MRVLLLLTVLLFAAPGLCEEDDDGQWEDTPVTTQLWQLISSGDVDGLNRLVSQNAKWAHLRSADGRGALFWAYEYKQSKIVSMLVNAGVSADAQDKDGKTPAELAPAGFKHSHDPTAKFVYTPPPQYADDDDDDDGVVGQGATDDAEDEDEDF
eukprot:TRINITY_DN10592_c2_g1_i1.p1 TRINITY_DN10592_c2_g1~~TRINITY_DN10592_c2_g1_i1.p1  ORF type:complete len:154 (-),score=48.97 TRINITY_DN10592_c2_g1_i1:97-558(-)